MAFKRSTELAFDEQRVRLRQMLDAGIGASLCAVAAFAVSELSMGHSWQTWAPLAFVAILLLTAALFGALAGILGTIVAAVIFATLLFKPVGSIHVSSEVARGNLAWMLLAGISYAFLFAPTSSGLRRH